MNSQGPIDNVLAEERNALLALLLEEEGIAILQTNKIRPRSRENDLPLSYAQQRLWFIEQLFPGNPAYNVAVAVQLVGQLDMASMERSLNEIVRRHEILRTTFKSVKGNPIQVIAPTLALRLPVIDLRGINEVEQAAKVKQLLQEEACRPFDLTQGPLLRILFLQLTDEEHVVLAAAHHIVADGWSMRVLTQELATLYATFVSGYPLVLPKLSIQYADFAIWQREWLQGATLADQLAYWKQQLDGAPPLLELATNRPRPPVQTFTGTQHSLTFSKFMTATLNEFCQQENATLFMTLLAVFNVLLHHYSGQEDILVGSPIAGRNQRQIEELIGFFVNTLVLRTDLSNDPTFRGLLARVREVTLEAFEHQDLPFEKLVEEMGVKRSPSYNPLFQVLFVLQNALDEGDISRQYFTLKPLQIDYGIAQHDLELKMWESSDGLKGVFEYRTDLLTADTISRMAQQFETVLRTVVAQPEIKLSTLTDMLEQDKGLEIGARRQLLREKLPAFMVSTTFAVPDALPLTTNDKVDQRALPATDEGQIDNSSKEYVAPSTPFEQLLAGIWGDQFGLQRVSVHNNFFELGGHSILAMQVNARMQEAFEIELPLITLFELPTIEGLATRIESILKTAGNVKLLPLRPMPRQAEVLPSFAQQRLWFLYQLEKQSVAYNMPGIVRVKGKLNISVLERSLHEMVRRHEILRTTFAKVDGELMQIVAPTMTVTLRVVDMRVVPRLERKSEALRWAAEEVQRPFDLARGPLLRTTLLQLNEDDYFLIAVMHHIISDGWSIGVLINELAALYEAFLADEAVLLDELPIQYADFSLWQREWLQGETLERLLTYWKEQLADSPPMLALPTDRLRPPTQSYQGALQSFVVPASLAQPLLSLARQENATLFMTYLAAFKTLLYRYSNQSDILVGSPIANRNHSDIERLIGFFANTIVLRTDLSGNPTFRELLGRVREVALGAYTHQDLPFERLVEELHLERDLSRSPLFQVMFDWQNTAQEPITLPNLTLTPVPVDTKTAKFDLTLSLAEREDELDGLVEYNTDLYDATTIDRMIQHFLTELSGIVADPDTRLAALPLIAETAQEYQQLVFEWNDTQADYPKHMCFHELFEAQVEKTPNAVAVVCEGEQLSYQELNKRANRLAHLLVEQNVGPDVVVALLGERGIDFLTAMLGVWKAGGAYLPLDPRHPTQRHIQVLTQAEVPLVLTASQFCSDLSKVVALMPSEKRPQVLELQALLQEVRSSKNLPARAMPNHLAYVIFTSGSTGVPKGAMVEQRGMVNHLYAMISNLALTSTDIIAQTASQCFDISRWQFTAALLTGGCVHILLDEVTHHPKKLLEKVEQNRISILEIVPSMLRAILELIVADKPVQVELSALRWLIATGEALQPELCRQWFAYYPNIPMINAYGPTECSDDVTLYSFEEPPAPEIMHMPIGRAIANTQLYVLNSQLQPVPIGVTGELYIGGDGLGRGYLKDPLRTAQTFVPNPFAQRAGSRLYKTGDQVRYRPDGTLEFLGRIDHQVKIRGFRIELGAIEAVLAQHANIREVVVVVREEGPSDKRLVAYLSVYQETVTVANELRAFLHSHLPDYMVPNDFIVINALPLTPNGKVDRQALPAPREVPTSARQSVVTPRDMVEHKLAQIWETTLDTPSVSITANFFELGGHSLLAVRTMALIEKQFGRELPVSSLFQGATIEHLAHMLREEANPELWSALVSIQPHGSRPPLFCVHPTGGDVLCYHQLARLLGPDQPFYGLQALGLDGKQEPYTNISDMAAYYIEAIRTVQPEGPYLLGGWSFGGLVAFEMAQQLRRQGEEIALLAIFDSLAPRAHAAHTEYNMGQEDWAEWVMFITSEFEDVFKQSLSLSYDELKRLKPDEQLNYFLEGLQTIDFLPPGAGVSIARGFWRVHEANTKAMWNYTSQIGAHPIPITLFISEEAMILEDSWDREAHDNPTLGWDQLAAGPLDVYTVPGNHNTLLSPPNVQILAEQLKGCLGQVTTEDLSSKTEASIPDRYLKPIRYLPHIIEKKAQEILMNGHVKIENLSKIYQIRERKGLFKVVEKQIVALKNISLEIKPGEIFGLLGPNGAGKTTLIKCLVTLLVPTSGSAWINGYSLGKENNQIQATIGCMLMGERGLYWKLTGRENLLFFGALYHLNRTERRRRADEIIERLNFGDIADRAVETYSSGQKMKLAFAKSLINDAPLLILDEPTNALDLPSARELRAFVRELNREGKTIIYTTHIMAEAETLCERVAIIDHGEVLALGTVPELKASLQQEKILRVEGVISPEATRAAQSLQGVTRVATTAVNGFTQLTVVSNDQREMLPHLINTLTTHNTVIHQIWPQETTLEDVFIAHTGRTLAEDTRVK